MIEAPSFPKEKHILYVRGENMDADKIKQILKEGERCKKHLTIVGPTGPMGPTGPSGGGSAVYGGMYNRTVQFLPFTAADTPVPIQFNTELPHADVGTSGNTIIVEQTGDYLLFYNVLISASQPGDVSVGVRRNGTLIEQTRGSQTLSLDDTTTLTHDGRLTGSTIVSLTSGDVLDVVISVLRTLPTGFDAVVNNYANATFYIQKVSSI